MNKLIKEGKFNYIEIGNGKTTTTLTIKNQEENITLPPYFFEFNVGDYPNYYLKVTVFVY